MTGSADARRDEIAANLARVQGRISQACARSGRDPGEVTLTVVTKFFPDTDVRLLAELGVRHVGENRHQEAQAKAAQCADLGLTWHFIGGLQSNKAAAVASYSDVVESVDRAKLLAGLARGAHSAGRQVDVLVQVGLDPEEASRGRSGVAPQAAAELSARVVDTQGLRLRGVMAVAPLGADPLPAFRKLLEVAQEVRRVDPTATWVSAGMSNDFEVAIAAGATHVRIGSAVLGARPAKR